MSKIDFHLGFNSVEVALWATPEGTPPAERHRAKYRVMRLPRGAGGEADPNVKMLRAMAEAGNAAQAEA